MCWGATRPTRRLLNASLQCRRNNDIRTETRKIKTETWKPDESSTDAYEEAPRSKSQIKTKKPKTGT
jgi:hypothetical protein